MAYSSKVGLIKDQPVTVTHSRREDAVSELQLEAWAVIFT